jgi:Tfp pilus assembly protein PilN
MQFIKAKRIKRLVTAVAGVVMVISVLVFVALLLYVDVAQKTHLKAVNNVIQSNTSQLGGNTNLDKILTIQNQLAILPQLEAQTPAVSRMFTYLTQLTPTNASISSLSADFDQDTFTITGSADSLDTINKFVDSIKFTTFKASSDNTAAVVSAPSSGDAFSTVVLSAFGYTSSNTSGQPANFTITFDFNPVIFNNTDSVTLTVPPITTTRSVIGQPTNLFEKSTSTTSGKG